ncbi:hypothetical protein GCM10022204_11820 [Microlunatus aurantiacus]|uniref:histidine kinase n=1 Tax=Microlunatus aurantiacus TaxID=446786 RepID=A0ABP7D199_9ACTN
MLDPVPVIAPSVQVTSMYHQIVECGNEGIWVFDLDGRTAYVNLRMAQMLDYSVPEMTARSLLDVLDEQGREQGAAFLARQRAEGGTTESAECLLLRRDGEAVWTVVSHSPWLDQDGTLRGLIAFVNDITDRRRLDEALRRREEQLAEAQRVARLGSWEWVVGTDHLTWSDELYRIFELRPGEFAGTLPAYLELVHPEDRERTAEVIQACLHGQPGFEFEQRILVPGRDRAVWVRTAGEVLTDGTGAPVRMRGTALDITAYKETEDRLRRARSRHRLLQTMAAAANEAQTLREVALMSVQELCRHLRWPAGRVHLVSGPERTPVPTGGWQRPQGTTEPADAERPPELSRAMPGLGEISAYAAAAVADAATVWSVGGGPPGGVGSLSACAVPVLSRDEVVAVLEFVVPTEVSRNEVDRSEAGAICEEVAIQLAIVAERERTSLELHAARDTALAALRAKSAFLATMSHEIRTPMNGVIGLAELLQASDLDDRQRQYVAGVQTAGDALLMIINDILDFSKIEAGRLELQTVDLDVTQLIEDVAELLARQAQAKDLELLTCSRLGAEARLRADPSRLRQVLINLVSNAIKFTEQGEVVLSAGFDPGTPPGEAETVAVRFEVTDTGIGIDASDQQLVFEPFTQVDGSSTRRFGGTGLGLAISRDLVEAMGGELQVDSRLGDGSRFGFTVRLPRSDSSTEPSPSRTPAPPWGGTAVLVVDDNTTSRLILQAQLSGWGLVPQLAADAATGLDLLLRAADHGRPFAVALVDLAMPGTDGLELARRIDDTPALTGTRVVLLTTTEVTPDRLAGAGLAAYVDKPVRSAQLYDRLAEVLRPVLEPDPEGPPAAADPPAPGHARVLVVEDNAINQLVARGLLDRLGFECDLAGTGYEALDALGRTDYAAVLMDCQMPEMDGYTATGELRRREGGRRHTPVIAMTAGALVGDEARCLAAGMDAYVPKPIDSAQLEAVLARWVPGGARR